MACLALDVGGANLKAADGRGYAAERPFALWREPARLADELRALISAAPPGDRLVATMTGELCDCFQTKAAGVRAIVEAIEAAAGGRSIEIYLTNGRWATADEARDKPSLAAASNWHALAAFAARFVGERRGIVIDIGSTTSDLVPLIDGLPAASGGTDTERLLTGELVYTGVERTPVSAVVAHLPWRGRCSPIAAELFATTGDAYLTLGDLAEEPGNSVTADSRPSTVEAARARLARMICADVTMFDAADARRAAEAIRDRQLLILEGALGQIIGRRPKAPEIFVICGRGEFLAKPLVEQFARDGRVPELVSLTEVVGAQVSRVAPAHALAVLANERVS